jgi:hypothetical protein
MSHLQVHLAIDDDHDSHDDDESQDDVHCPACDSVDVRLLGVLGSTVHIRCADCGADHHRSAS